MLLRTQGVIRLFSLLVVISAAGTSARAQGAVLPGQRAIDPRIPTSPSTTPPGKDTAGYWQQRVDYTIVATLDEGLGGIRARGTMTYVNRSPDTLRDLWLHQHLNAFRPGSRWSATDAREGRTRFQALGASDYAYERFTALPRIDHYLIVPEYPLAPDSSVVLLALQKPLREIVAPSTSPLSARHGGRTRLPLELHHDGVAGAQWLLECQQHHGTIWRERIFRNDEIVVDAWQGGEIGRAHV